MKQSYQIVLYLIGVIFIPMGVVLIVNAHLGAGGYDALNFILAEKLNINTGIAIYITAGVFSIITAIIRNSLPNLKAYISAILIGFFTDLWKIILDPLQVSVFSLNILIFLVGMIVVCFGIAAYILSGFPTNPTDDFVVCLTEKGWSIVKAKIFMDVICVIIAYLLGGEIGLATIIITISSGPIINWFNDALKNLLIKGKEIY